MITKNKIKANKLVIFITLLIIFFISLKIFSQMEIGKKLDLDSITLALSYFSTSDSPIILNKTSLSRSLFVTFFLFLLYVNTSMNKKNTLTGNTFGSAEWATNKDAKKYRDPNFKNNMILTQTEWFSANMSISLHNRNVLLLGMPGKGKSRFYFKPNILNAHGTIVATDPKGELLRDTGMSLIFKGYTIKVLDLRHKWKSNHYNPFKYIKKLPCEAYSIEQLKNRNSDGIIAEDDVMTLINTIMSNTKSENIQNATGDPFWEKTEMIFLQSIFFYMLFNYPKPKQNFHTVMELIRLANPDQNGVSELDKLFKIWETKDPNNIGVKQYKHFKGAASAPKTMSTIILTASARLAPFNIPLIDDMTYSDDMELERIGKPEDEGKIAYFIITDPNDSSFNFLASIFYTQIFSIIDSNAELAGGSLATPVDLYMEEWAQLGEIPRFVEILAYVRGLNCGVTIGLQSLSQLKKVNKDSWETVLDCCDYTLFLGSNSKETLEYISTMLGKQTLHKRSTGKTYSRQKSSSSNYDETGRELAYIDELQKLPKGKCILLVTGHHPFYSDLYDLTKHPDYDDLYEPWQKQKTIGNFYDHFEQMRMNEQERRIHDVFASIGLPFVKMDQTLKMRKLSSNQLKSIKNEVILSSHDDVLDFFN